MRVAIFDTIEIDVLGTKKQFGAGRILRFTPEKAREIHEEFPTVTKLIPDDEWDGNMRNSIKAELKEFLAKKDETSIPLQEE